VLLVLPSTLLAGPAGLLLYLILKGLKDALTNDNKEHDERNKKK
jgi:hypothetical protein